MSMSFDFYHIKNIFLACPGDLTSERSCIPKIINEINHLYSHEKGFHLELIGWETVLPDSGRPQSIINNQLRDADLVIVMLNTRIGSESRNSTTINGNSDEDKALRDFLPPGWVEQHKLPITGTIEEYCLSRYLNSKSGRPSIGIYFKKQMSDNNERHTEHDPIQLAGIKIFRRHLEGGKELFFREFEDEESFESLIKRHLTSYINGQQRTNAENIISKITEIYNKRKSEYIVINGDFLAHTVYGFPDTFKEYLDLDMQAQKPEEKSNPHPLMELNYDINADGKDESISLVMLYDHGATYTHIRVISNNATYLNPVSKYFLKSKGEGDVVIKYEIMNLAVADINHDGVPEIIIGARENSEHLTDYIVHIFAFNQSNGNVDLGTITEIFSDKTHVGPIIFSQQKIIVPTSPGMYMAHGWNENKFESISISYEQFWSRDY